MLYEENFKSRKRRMKKNLTTENTEKKKDEENL